MKTRERKKGKDNLNRSVALWQTKKGEKAKHWVAKINFPLKILMVKFSNKDFIIYCQRNSFAHQHMLVELTSCVGFQHSKMALLQTTYSEPSSILRWFEILETCSTLLQQIKSSWNSSMIINTNIFWELRLYKLVSTLIMNQKFLCFIWLIRVLKTCRNTICSLHRLVVPH